MRRLLFSLALFPCSLLAQTSRSPDQALETGKILAHVTCAADPEQTYALYLPPNYSPDRRWPLVISSDPSARGSAPLELQKDAAELYGYVLASSNNSRNGPWKLGFDAIIYATALHHCAPLITSDSHLANLPGVTLT